MDFEVVGVLGFVGNFRGIVRGGGETDVKKGQSTYYQHFAR